LYDARRLIIAIVISGCRIHERHAGGVHVLDLEGPLTNGDAIGALRARVRGLVENGQVNLVLNLEGVPYIDSSGLGELVRVHTTLLHHHGELKLVNATRRLRDLLVMTRLAPIFESFDSEAGAIASFTQPRGEIV